MQKIWDRIQKWWEGEFIPPPEDSTGSNILLCVGSQKYSLSRRFLAVLGQFWLNHWTFIIMAIIALAGVIIAGIVAFH